MVEIVGSEMGRMDDDDDDADDGDVTIVDGEGVTVVDGGETIDCIDGNFFFFDGT